MEGCSTYLSRGDHSKFNKGHSVSSMRGKLQVNEKIGSCSGPGDMIKSERNQGIPVGMEGD